MPEIKLPGNAGTVFMHGTQAEADQQKAFLEARHAFAMGYCKSKGWPEDASQLSIDQLLEIRAQEGWKHPTNTSSQGS